MKLIRKLGTRKRKNGVLISLGEFLCPNSECNKIVIRRLDVGLKQNYCGCIPKYYKHGGKGTRLYNIWQGMKQRILNQNAINYSNYGGRGITICDEWLEFIPFRDWSLANGYAENLTIDRKDPNNDYFPENCRWIFGKENSKNQRTNKLNQEKANEIRFKYNSGYYTKKVLSEWYKVSLKTISLIINNKIWI